MTGDGPRVAALMVLGVVLVAMIVCLTVVAVATERHLGGAGFAVIVYGLLVLALSGAEVRGWRMRRRRWKIQTNGGTDDD